MNDEFDAAVAATLRQDLGQAARVGFYVAADTDPDAYAEAQRVARRTGVPVETVFSMPKDMKRQAAVGAIDFDALAKTAPATARLLADIDKARSAHDDTQTLSALETALRPAARAVRHALAGVTFDLSAGAYGLLETGFKLVAPLADPLAGTLLPENPLRRVAAGLEGWRKNQQAMAERVAGDVTDAGFVERSVYSGFRSFGQMLPGMVATVLTGNPNFALGSAGLLQGSQSAAKALDAGKTPLSALIYGAEDAVAEIATERIPIGRLLKDLKAGAPFLTLLGRQIATEVPTEMVATAWQKLNEWANLRPDRPVSEYLESLPEDEAQTVIATIATTVLTAGMGKGVHRLAERAQRRAEEAQQSADIIARLNDLAKASKLARRDPDTFEQFIAQAAEDGPVSHVFIDAKTLLQSGVAEQVAAASPTVASQLSVAAQTGGVISIPIEEYAARIAPTEASAALLDHLRVDPEGFSRAEAQQYMQSYAEELKAEVERALAEKQGDDAFKRSTEAVKARLVEALNALGRFTPAKNEADATLIASYYAVRAAQLGMLPEELFAKRPLHFAAERVDGGYAFALDQGEVPKTERIDERTGLPLNEDGTVTVYHHTTVERAAKIREEGVLRSAGEPDLYFTTRAEPDIGYGEVAIPVRVRPERLVLDDEFPDGRRDFRVEAPKRARSLQFLPDDSARLMQEAIDKEFADTAKVYGGREAYEKAKAQGRTKLDYRQWVEVRTPSFKKRFGDWEALRAQQRLDAMAPIEVRVPREWRELPIAELRKRVREDLEALVQQVGAIDHPEAGKVRITKSGVKKTISEGRDPAKLLVAADLANVLPRSVYAGSVAVEGKQNIIGYGKLLARVRVAGHDLVAVITTRIAADGHTYYNTVTVEDAQKQAPDEAGAVTAGLMRESSASAEVDPPLTAVTHFIRRPLVRVNPDSVSKAVDPDTGEPIDAQQVAPGGHLRQGASAALARWKTALGRVSPDRPDYAAQLDTPAVLRALGVDAPTLRFPARYIRAVRARHPDVPAEVFENLPALLSDPLYALPAKGGGIDVVLDALSAKGSPLVVGVREGRIRTITPLDPNEAESPADRLTRWWRRAMEKPDARFYARNKEAPAVAGASAGGDSGAHSLASFVPPSTRNLITRDALVKRLGEDFYQGARGAFDPRSFTISLLKGADLSTALHEAAHFFFENDIALASELAREAKSFGMDALKPGERQLLADVSTLLSWHGIQGDIHMQLATWHALEFEERRAYHERTAESFEAYLLEGKAPSIELQSYFQRFRAWLLNVYRSLKEFLTRYPEAGKLNDEVRAVFDRMLATSEQIQLAEQARSLFPLFASPEQAGMTPEEFAAYQSLGVEATNAAIEELQARGLRDMRWLRNARSRAIARLQRRARAKRAEVKIEARREILSQPVYRAWQFLTGKLTDEDRLPPEERKSDPDRVDETRDSLFVAITKLGGLNRAATQAEWGIDPKERIPTPVFGKPVLRRDGGLSLDAMAEALAERGYLSVDEHGKHDLREFEEKFFEELRGQAQYFLAYDYDAAAPKRPGDQVANPQALGAGRLDRGAVRAMGLPDEVVSTLEARRMVAGNGLHPDIVAEMFDFTSGDELVRALAEATPPKEAIEALADLYMLERYGDLATPEAIERAADEAIHNDVRARFLATEANALAKAAGRPKVLTAAAKMLAQTMVARLKVRDIKPGQYANAQARAAKAAEKARNAGNIATAAAEKRNQLIQHYAARAAYDALDEIERGLRYLRKFAGDIKGLDADYADQIHALLERFDLRKGQSNKAIDSRTALARWLEVQREAGFEPDIPPELANEAFRTHYKNLTVEEFRGLVDSVRQIEHLGRLKNRLLTARKQKAYEAARDEIVSSIEQHARGREADTRTPTTATGRFVKALTNFGAEHIKAASWARILDGGGDGGPMWEYFIRTANERAAMEATMRAEATQQLSAILAPVLKRGRMGGKGQYFPSIGRSLNRQERLAIALNVGNEGNLQRLLGGEGWTLEQVLPILRSLTVDEWRAVQAIWDYFESYRPKIAEKERRIYGKEPAWVEPRSFEITTADGQTIRLRGGYYPIKYDPAASQRAEEHADAEAARRQLQGAYTSATTRRSFTKARVEEVHGRPLLYNLTGLYSGVNDIIHDLAWHEWLIDVNRLLRSDAVDRAIRGHYGPEVVQQFKSWVNDIAEGEKRAENAVESAAYWLRHSVTVAGLGFNFMTALMQPLGITQSIVRVGAPWIARGVVRYAASPVEITRRVGRMSEFMANRMRTRFRELNELRNQIEDQGAVKRFIGRYAYAPMMFFQSMVDVPTWWGAYEKAIAEGYDETRAIALADQAVIDSQGGGEVKDLSAIERGKLSRLFTAFYSYMNAALNLGVVKTMTADTPARRAKLAVDYLMLYTVPAVLVYFLKAALTPGDSGDDDDLEKLARRLAAEQLSYLMGLMVLTREFSEVAKIVTGDPSFGYAGPAGLRFISDTIKFTQQAAQGEIDDAFRKAAVNLLGDLARLPSAQINRTITGVKALSEGETDNPAAVVFGFEKRR